MTEQPDTTTAPDVEPVGAPPADDTVVDDTEPDATTVDDEDADPDALAGDDVEDDLGADTDGDA